MTDELAKKTGMADETLLKIATGDTSKLSPKEKIQLILQVCEISGLDPRLAPFEFIRFQGREVMYARKNATDQLVNVHKIKLEIVDDKVISGIYRVRCKAETKDGRATMDDGAVAIDGIKGNDLANAMMRATTKAKRRTVLSLCGLSMLDESEIETVPGPKTYTKAAELVEAAQASEAAEGSQVPPEPERTEFGDRIRNMGEAHIAEKANLAKIARTKAIAARHKDFLGVASKVLGREVRNVIRDLSLEDLTTLEDWERATEPGV